MPIYNVVVEVVQIRSYELTADSQEDANRIIRDDFTIIPFDIIESEVENVTVLPA